MGFFPFLLLTLLLQISRLGLWKKLGVSTAKTADPNLPEGYFKRYIMCSLVKVQQKEEDGRTFGATAFIFPRNC